MPVVISVMPHMRYITGPKGANTFLMTPWKTEKRMIYPPSFVMDSNPFIIEVSRISPTGDWMDISFSFLLFSA